MTIARSTKRGSLSPQVPWRRALGGTAPGGWSGQREEAGSEEPPGEGGREGGRERPVGELGRSRLGRSRAAGAAGQQGPSGRRWGPCVPGSSG